jgi:hypothetical protein
MVFESTSKYDVSFVSTTAFHPGVITRQSLGPFSERLLSSCLPSAYPSSSSLGDQPRRGDTCRDLPQRDLATTDCIQHEVHSYADVCRCEAKRDADRRRRRPHKGSDIVRRVDNLLLRLTDVSLRRSFARLPFVPGHISLILSCESIIRGRGGITTSDCRNC